MICAIFVLIVVGILIAVQICKSDETSQNNMDSEAEQEEETFTCPTCGSPATIRGSQWECGYCGDTGTIS